MALSIKWLKQAAQRANADTGFRREGNCDAVVGLCVGPQTYSVTFAGFACTEVSAIARNALREVDFYLDMPKADWENWLSRRSAGDGPTLAELDLERQLVSANDPARGLAFTRYHRSLDAYFRLGASNADL